MNVINLVPYNKRNFLSLLLLFFSFNIYTAYSSESSYIDDWRSSLNVTIGTRHVDFNEWYIQNSQCINVENRDRIQSKLERPAGDRNIAVARLFILYDNLAEKRDEESFPFITFDLKSIFMSGMGKFKEADPIVIEQNLKEKVITASSFSQEEMSGKDLNRMLADQINDLLGGTFIREGTHSEGSMLINMTEEIRGVLNQIGTNETLAESMCIRGFILQVLSLNDPCDKCYPMLRLYAENFRAVLEKIVESDQIKIKISPTLENLILYAGTRKFLTSRNGISPQDEPLVLNLDAPSNRIILARLEDLNQAGEKIDTFLIK
jgi:hypothetical protein